MRIGFRREKKLCTVIKVVRLNEVDLGDVIILMSDKEELCNEHFN
jgi:hypothetical protein